jgi:acyl carrier protein
MAFKVTLNGANYVSDERQAAFERSLETASPTRTSKVSGNGSNGGNGSAHSPETLPATPPATVTPLEAVQVAPEPSQPAPMHLTIDPGRVLDGLEWGLSRSYDHQSETLQVHQHYLANEAAYAAIVAQLMREQSSLFGNGGAAGEAAARVLETLSRSMEQFHHHQSETLSAHSQFLAQQAAYAESFVDVLRHQYGAVLSGAAAGNGHGNGNGGNGVSAPLPYRPQPTPAVAPPPVQERQMSPTRPAPVVSPVVAAPLPASQSPAPVVTPVAISAPAPLEAAAPAEVVAPAKAAAPAAWNLSQDLLGIVSEKTGYPVEMLELEMDMEADLGIDSIKRVEILGALQDLHPELPEVETDALAELRTLAEVVAYTEGRSGATVVAVSAQPVVEPLSALPDVADTVVVSAGDLLAGLPEELLAIVSEKTGYPAEMLELGMDMEADLGIDSIKRVEILGALQDLHPELPEVETDALAELRTLAQVLGYVQGKAGLVADSGASGERTSQDSNTKKG